jgi:hypothetical protein
MGLPNDIIGVFTAQSYPYCIILIYLVWPCDHDTFDGAELEQNWYGFGAHLGAKGGKKHRVQIFIINHWKFPHFHHILPRMDNHDEIGLVNPSVARDINHIRPHFSFGKAVCDV